jgi:HAD superfamily hydrolase (TIGR01509 family)
MELVIFDCDGVLVDSERIAVKVDAAVLADLGCHFTEAEIIDRFVGSSREVFTAEVEAQLGRRLQNGWWNAYERLYQDAYDVGLTAVGGIAEALEKIASPMCVASNGRHDGIQRKLQTVGLYERFKGCVFSAADVPRGKPAPDLFLHAARAMGADPSRCTVVEDSIYGVEAARAARMRAFGYSGGLTSSTRLSGPDTVIFNDMRDLPQLLKTARLTPHRPSP